MPISKAIRDAVDLLSSFREGDAVAVTESGRTNDFTVSRDARRSDGAFGSYESTHITVSMGVGRYAREVTAEQLAAGRCTITRRA